MRIAIFFDGKNFYSGWRSVERPRVDFPLLARWLVKRVNGSMLWGAHYYTGVEVGEASETPQQDALRSYLEMLDFQPGFFVHRFPRHQPNYTCPTCGNPIRVTQEKEVDTALVADIVRFATLDAYDCLILVSGDGDHVPAVEAIRALGKQAYVATWGRCGLSRRLRLASFDHIDLLDGLDVFCERDGVGSNGQGGIGTLTGSLISAEDASDIDDIDPEKAMDFFVHEIARAQDKFEKFENGYVGVHYFLTRWKFDRFDISAEQRRRLLDDAVDAGRVEIYEADDGAKALRAASYASPAPEEPTPDEPPPDEPAPEDRVW